CPHQNDSHHGKQNVGRAWWCDKRWCMSYGRGMPCWQGDFGIGNWRFFFFPQQCQHPQQSNDQAPAGPYAPTSLPPSETLAVLGVASTIIRWDVLHAFALLV